MVAPLVHFLLIYNRDTDELVSSDEYHDAAEAIRAYDEAEQQAQAQDENMDVVLVGSDSLETVRVTHSNYFSGNALRRVREALGSFNLAQTEKSGAQQSDAAARGPQAP